MIMAMATSAMLAITANAEGGDLASSKAVTGTKALLDDLSNVLLVVAPIAGSILLCVMVQQMKWIRKNGSSALLLLSFP